jgi:hypothetical protein
MIRIIAIAGLILLAAESRPNARDELASLRQQAHSARESGDHAGYLRAALTVRAMLNGNPNAVESVARAYTEAGDREKAFEALTEFARMEQVDESLLDGTSKTFASLSESARYGTILETLRTNKSPVSAAQQAFSLSDPGLVAEDIDYDSLSKSFLITSVLEKKIIRVNKAGRSSDFASSPSHWPMLALKVDGARKLAWATEVALDGFTAAPKADWGRSALLCFELATGKLLHRIEGPKGAALGDMVLAPNGDPILSDGAQGGIYRFENGVLKLVNGIDFISPQTPSMLPDGKHVVVPDYLRGLGILDLASGAVRWLTYPASTPIALNGIDGVYFHRGSLFLTQNGTSPKRVLQLRLDSSLTEVTPGRTIERTTQTLGDPTHGVLVNSTFYYIANSGWSELDDHGDLKPGFKLTPAHIMRFVAE